MFIYIYIYIYIYKGKGKVYPRTGHEGPEGSRGIAVLFLDGVGGQRNAPATPETTRYPLYRKVGGPQGRSR